MPLSPIEPFEKLHLSATEQVFDTLYQAVISIKLPPGAKVSETEIAKQLNVSRQPVRDAFYRLSNLGFLSIRPQRATLITQISLRAVMDAMFVRTALEVACLHCALQDWGKLLSELQENLYQQKRALQAEPAVFHALDEAFHEIICKVAGHSHVWILIKEQKAHLDRIRYLTLSEERRATVMQEHQSIIDAIQTGDAAQAEAALRLHIEGVKPVIDPLKTKYPEYFE